MGVLDIISDKKDTINFLSKQPSLSDDLHSLLTASMEWIRGDKKIHVGESGTLYRFLKFLSWKKELHKEFVKKGTLTDRKITDNPKIVRFHLEELLNLDHQTSQWASAAVLLGNEEYISNPPYKLQLTYEAVKHWNLQRAQGKTWIPRYDETILRQARSFLELLNTGTIEFTPLQAEDYCFARIFGLMTPEEAEKRWASLQGHESNRIKSMEITIEQIRKEEVVDSKDHRIVQAAAMYCKYKNANPKIQYPEVVEKSWPQFWYFLNNIS